MQATTEKLCCRDVFSQKFVGSPETISCFSRTARRRIERSQPCSSCSVWCRTSSNRLYSPLTARTWTPLTTLYGGLCSRACIAFPFPIWRISRTECAPAVLDQQIIDKSVDQWRDRLKTVVRVNGGHVGQLFQLSGSLAAVLSSVAYAFWKHACILPLCIVRYCGTVTKKVNMANNHFTLQDKRCHSVLK